MLGGRCGRNTAGRQVGQIRKSGKWDQKLGFGDLCFFLPCDPATLRPCDLLRTVGGQVGLALAQMHSK